MKHKKLFLFVVVGFAILLIGVIIFISANRNSNTCPEESSTSSESSRQITIRDIDTSSENETIQSGDETDLRTDLLDSDQQQNNKQKAEQILVSEEE